MSEFTMREINLCDSWLRLNGEPRECECSVLKGINDIWNIKAPFTNMG